jgi:NAD(P)-dependent dehydrogenase (short-subunit alcohol dehydrogenase family)
VLAERVLREGLLEGVSVLLAPAPARTDALGATLRAALAGLGARVSTCQPHVSDEEAVDEAVRAAMANTGGIDLLVLDAAALFGDGAPTALRTCLDSAWNVTRAVINNAFLPAGRAGRIVYLAPAPDAGERVMAARAGLENLARTLSVEWARHNINVITIAPGSATPADEIATLLAYLASPAGIYFSGCLLDLSGAASSPR